MVMMRTYLDIPAKVLDVNVQDAVGVTYWPYNNGSGDPFWQGGAQPTFYRWVADIQVTPQTHSSHRTRKPRAYTGMDVRIGDYIASVQDGIALKIVSIEFKSDTFVRAVLEDTFRYNTFRDGGSQGVGIFTVPSGAIIFEVNEEGLPVVDPVPATGVGSNFFPNLMSRFLNFEKNVNFIIHQSSHGFQVGQMISADPVEHRFVPTSAAYPFLIGSVTYTDLGPDTFMVNPLQKIVDDYDFMPGQVGDVLYADPMVPGGLTTTAGTTPVMIKLRDHTNSGTTGTVANGATTPGSSFNLNGIPVVVGGSGSLGDFITAVNLTTAQHGVTATAKAAPTVVSTTLTTVYGEPAIYIPNGASPRITINGTPVTFSTTIKGLETYNDTYALEEDMAADINAAAITDIRARFTSNTLIIENIAGDDIVLVNVIPDGNGNPIVGDNSATGLPLSASGSTQFYARLDAADARAIDLWETNGSPVADFGLFSVDNGVKSAALYIEQGIRKANLYLVPDVASRDNLSVIVGDQAHVLDKGDGEWGLFLYDGSNWVMTASFESAKTDSDAFEVVIDHTTAGVGLVGELNDGSRVNFVTVSIIDPFDDPAATLSIGDDDNSSRLMSSEQNDLTQSGDFTTTPTVIYSTGGDVDVKYFLNPGASTMGRAKVAISYN